MNRFHRANFLHFIVLASLCVSIQISPGLGSQTSSADTASPFDADKATITPEASRPQSCGVCGVGGPNVDVYYWPQTSANTSCLSIIGPTPSPPLAGATTANGVTYWGYTNTDAPHNFIQTMQLTSINGITFKMPLVDPWPDTATVAVPDSYVLQEPIGKRAYSAHTPILIERRAPFNESRGLYLSNDSAAARNQSHLESTVVFHGHTLTSPSIYVDFYSLTATDLCGTLGGGRDGVITSTLMAFAPGELSTFAAPLNEWLYGMQPGLTSYIVPYNFADLPCPPYQTMTDQWYKPEPGEPYRPIIAFPSKVLDVDPLWKTCTPAFFTGLDPPTVLHPATALVPLVTPAADTKPQHVAAKPSPSLENTPENTAKPPVQQVPPARNTAAPDPAINDPSHIKEKSMSAIAVDPGTLTGSSDSNDPDDDSGSSSGETIDQPGNEATSPKAKPGQQAQPAAGVGNSDSAENSSPKGDKGSQADPSTVESPKGDSDPGSRSQSNPTDAVSLDGPGDPQQYDPIATAGGEPIVAVPQQASSAENSNSGPDAGGGDNHKSPKGSNDDTKNTKPSDSLGIFDPQSIYSAANDAPTNYHPAAAPVPFTTTIGGHVVQVQSSPSAILVDGNTVTRGHGSITVSGTPIALQQDGNLVLGTSTVRDLLPALLPAHDSPFTAGDQLLTADHNAPHHAPVPTRAPQVYRIGAARVTAGGPPITYAGTKIQAIGDGAVVVGGTTYRASLAPAVVRTTGGAPYPVVSGALAHDASVGSGAGGGGGSIGSKGGEAGATGSAGVVPYRGGATRGRVGWGLFVGSIVVRVMR